MSSTVACSFSSHRHRSYLRMPVQPLSPAVFPRLSGKFRIPLRAAASEALFNRIKRLLLERFPGSLSIVAFLVVHLRRHLHSVHRVHLGIIIVHGCLLISQHEICLSECNRLVIYSNCRFVPSTLSEPQPVSPIAAIEALSITQTAFAFKFSLLPPHAGRNVCSKEFSFTRSNFRSCIDFINAFLLYPFVDTGQLFSSLFTPFHTILWLCEYFTPV